MYNLAHSPSYRTLYLSWPAQLKRECPKCHSPIRYAFSDNGKVVRILTGPVHQILHFYHCINPECEYNTTAFTITPRLDAGKSPFGIDVIRYIAEEALIFKSGTQEIHQRLRRTYSCSISLRSVQRYYNAILQIKASVISSHTTTILEDRTTILLAIDGEEPDGSHEAIWIFTDLLTGRMLKAVAVSTMPFEENHRIIEENCNEYHVPSIGFVSDKQNNVVKCMKTYYPTIPHQ